jgi:hypothetical protein
VLNLKRIASDQLGRIAPLVDAPLDKNAGIDLFKKSGKRVE